MRRYDSTMSDPTLSDSPAPDATTVRVVDNPAEHRFEARLDGRVVAFSEYRLVADRIIFLHTETDAAVEGRGIGSTLVKGALDEVRGRGLRVTSKCPFVSAWLERHPEYGEPDARSADPTVARSQETSEAG